MEKQKLVKSSKIKGNRCNLNILDKIYKKEPAQEREGEGNFVLYLALRFDWNCKDIRVEEGYYYNLMMALA